jgi:hypothetical protein
MSQGAIRVLLVGETGHGRSELRLLGNQGYHFWLGPSFDEG